MRLATWFASIIALLPLAGCGLSSWAKRGFKLGPDYCRPAVAVADNWIDHDDPMVLPVPESNVEWWHTLQDPCLDELIREARRQNLTLRQAGQRILQARLSRSIAQGNLLPQQQFLDGGYTREQDSLLIQPAFAPSPDLLRRYDTWDLGGQMRWETDLWGRYRRAIEAADANLEASIFDYDAILISLIAEVATEYVSYRTFQERLRYNTDNIQSQAGSLKLTQAQFDEGLTSEVSVFMSRSNVEDVRASSAPLEIGLRQSANRLCILLGMPPRDLSDLLGEDFSIPQPPNEVLVGIPANLVRRRPDVREAERRVAVQSAQIGIAKTDLYPAININGTFSVAAQEFDDLFDPASYGASIGPSFQWNVLNYGRIKNNILVQESKLREQVLVYQESVLEANEEVENAMIAFLKSKEQVEHLTNTVEATQRALELEIINFKEGETDFGSIYVLQGTVASQQDLLASARGQVITSLIDVYRSLGGGWNASVR